MNKILLPLCLFFFVNFLTAQSPIEGGVFAGLVLYQGDLTENHIEPDELNFAFGGLLRYHFNKKFKLRGHVIYGKVTGSDLTANRPGQRNRGWSFESFIVETTLVAEYHPWGKWRENAVGFFEPHLSPYIGLGAGFASFNPKVTVTNPLDERLFPEKGKKTNSPSFPFVVGLRWDMFKFVILTAEAGWRLTFNDYLDGVSENANPNRHDPFIFTGLSLSYFFGYEETFNLR